MVPETCDAHPSLRSVRNSAAGRRGCAGERDAARANLNLEVQRITRVRVTRNGPEHNSGLGDRGPGSDRRCGVVQELRERFRRERRMGPRDAQRELPRLAEGAAGNLDDVGSGSGQEPIEETGAVSCQRTACALSQDRRYRCGGRIEGHQGGESARRGRDRDRVPGGGHKAVQSSELPGAVWRSTVRQPKRVHDQHVERNGGHRAGLNPELHWYAGRGARAHREREDDRVTVDPCRETSRVQCQGDHTGRRAAGEVQG